MFLAQTPVDGNHVKHFPMEIGHEPAAQCCRTPRWKWTSREGRTLQRLALYQNGTVTAMKCLLGVELSVIRFDDLLPCERTQAANVLGLPV